MSKARTIEWPLLLSWPAPVLSPNSRVHWSKRQRAKKTQRHEARMLCMAQVKPAKRAEFVKAGRLKLHLEFIQPDRKSRDADNLLASCKAAIDGIADAIGLDDRNFVISFAMSPHRIDRGGVRVSLEAA